MGNLAEVVKIDTGNLGNIPLTLRNLADDIERGELGEVKQLAFVYESSDGIHAGLIGLSGNWEADAYLLYARAQNFIVSE